MCIFKRNCWDSVLGVKSEHLGLLVGLGHVDIERITLDVTAKSTITPISTWSISLNPLDGIKLEK